MGCYYSTTVFTENELYAYQNVTGLNQAEILQAYRRFQGIRPVAFTESKLGKIPFVTVADTLPELRVNPFRYRITKVFCSNENGFMDFDDFLELVTVMNPKTSLSIKLKWAFQIFDFNEDDAICPLDLYKMIDSLTGGNMAQKSRDKIVNHIMGELDADGDGAISYQEFERVITIHCAPDFLNTFRFIL